MKITPTVFLTGIAFVVAATAATRTPIEEAAIQEFEVTVADVPTVFSRLRAKAEDATFTVFVFSPGDAAFDPDAAINLQFSFEDGGIGFDWVLLGQPNIRDRKKFEQLAASLGVKLLLKEKNDVHYLRAIEGDLPRLCERVICDLYGKTKEARIGLLTRGIQWP